MYNVLWRTADTGEQRSEFAGPFRKGFPKRKLICIFLPVKVRFFSLREIQKWIVLQKTTAAFGKPSHAAVAFYKMVRRYHHNKRDRNATNTSRFLQQMCQLLPNGIVMGIHPSEIQCLVSPHGSSNSKLHKCFMNCLMPLYSILRRCQIDDAVFPAVKRNISFFCHCHCLPEQCQEKVDSLCFGWNCF